MTRIFVAILSVLLLSSCAMSISQQRLETADYGPYPSDYEGIVRSFINKKSAATDDPKVVFPLEPIKGFHGIGDPTFGYIVCTSVDKKNTLGWYVGARNMYFLIRDGRVVAASYGDMGYGGDAKGKCRTALSNPDL